MRLALILSVGLAIHPAAAQVPPDRYECDFVRIGVRETLHLGFVYDRARERALMIGNNGTSDVLATQGSSVISFLELLGSGAVQTTTIDPQGNAIHSRHTFNREFMPSQWVGTCTRS